MTDQTPNSPNQLMAQVLESVLPLALKPIVSRLDRIEDTMIGQPPVTRDQMNYALTVQKNELLSQQLNNNQDLSSALIRLADRLEQGETERNQQLELFRQLLQAQRQDLKNLAVLPGVLNRLIDRIEQLEQQVSGLTECNQQQSQLFASLEQRLTDQQQTVDKLTDVSLPLHKGMNSIVTAKNSLKNQFSQDSQLLSNSLTQLTHNLVQREQGRNHQLEALTAQLQNLTQANQQHSQQIASLEQMLTDQQQTVDNLIDVLVSSSNAITGLSEGRCSQAVDKH